MQKVVKNGLRNEPTYAKTDKTAKSHPETPPLLADLSVLVVGSAFLEPFFTKTAAEILDTVRQVFPNARIVREPVSLVARGCLICGRVYYSRSEAESQYCVDGCTAVSHRRYKNPHRTRIRSLRDQCRASWRQALDRVEPQSFEEWLYRFEKFLERMCEMRREPPADQDL